MVDPLRYNGRRMARRCHPRRPLAGRFSPGTPQRCPRGHEYSIQVGTQLCLLLWSAARFSSISAAFLSVSCMHLCRGSHPILFCTNVFGFVRTSHSRDAHIAQGGLPVLGVACSGCPSNTPTFAPSPAPTRWPTLIPTAVPSTAMPTDLPTRSPTMLPTRHRSPHCRQHCLRSCRHHHAQLYPLLPRRPQHRETDRHPHRPPRRLREM